MAVEISGMGIRDVIVLVENVDDILILARLSLAFVRSPKPVFSNHCAHLVLEFEYQLRSITDTVGV